MYIARRSITCRGEGREKREEEGLWSKIQNPFEISFFFNLFQIPSYNSIVCFGERQYSLLRPFNCFFKRANGWNRGGQFKSLQHRCTGVFWSSDGEFVFLRYANEYNALNPRRTCRSKPVLTFNLFPFRNNLKQSGVRSDQTSHRRFILVKPPPCRWWHDRASAFRWLNWGRIFSKAIGNAGVCLESIVWSDSYYDVFA